MTCSQCGSAIKPGLAFCISCGAPTHAQALSTEDSIRISILEDALGGKYKILSKIGAGGFAAIYLGEHTRLHRKVAIKILHGGFSDDAGMVERFRRESQSAARLSHPNIIDIYDVGESADLYYFVMQYIQGISLSRKMELEKIIVPSEASPIIRQVADALAYAHENSVIHRDIKPANVMLDQFGKPVLMDFGIARVQFEQNITKAGSLMGTPLYLSPEQPLGHMVDGRSDIYSLGIMFYEMLAGRPPFENENPVALIFKHIHESPPDLSTIAPHVPPELCSIVHKMIEKDPNDRFQTGWDVVAALDAVDEARLKQDAYQRQVEMLTPDPKTILLPKETPIEIVLPPQKRQPVSPAAPKHEPDPDLEYVITARRPVPAAVSVRAVNRRFPWVPVLAVAAVAIGIFLVVIWKTADNKPVAGDRPEPLSRQETQQTEKQPLPAPVLVSIDTQPWAYIVVASSGSSGTLQEITPCMMKLIPGDYTVTFTSPNSNFKSFSRVINVSETNNRFRFQFDALDPDAVAEHLLQ